MPEILKNIKAEDRLKKIRIVSENDDVMGGQPEADGMKENDNNAIFDLACSVMHALAEVAKVDQKAIPQILDALGDSRTAGASQRIVNEVNKLAKAAQTAANQANDKANTANTAAATADKKAVAAQNKADSAYNLADSKQDKLTFTGTGNVARMSEVEKKRDLNNSYFNTPVAVERHDFAGIYLVNERVKYVIESSGASTDTPLYMVVRRPDDTNLYQVYFPVKTGTLALISDIPSVVQSTGTSITGVMSQKAVSDQLKSIENNHGLGYGQKWVNVTSQRTFDTLYKNNTNKPICVQINNEFDANYDPLKIFIDDTLIIETDQGNGKNWYGHTSFIVPAGSTYRAEKVGWKNLIIWSELQ
ncbi:hypothetical protein [Wohlfahrtiimonas chitiniclastica]|uniref:hypothetical protein n=1 Tax=Wohlfahrtiimonas chitiniclastica TaxID=400946 RepID=UPI001BD19E24|nr:hypothetical protein [Wohlfahrtiimonas chitiniclastica]MBS7819044.1 hypothetical protein [Wohlfahrtiimonas chitiniclastica]